MIQIDNKNKCCGCNACVQRCPKQCIKMKADNEGFLYPIVDTTTCIDCGICEKVCPVINKQKPRKPLKVYAAYNNNEEIRTSSSSGGIFTLIAEETIKKGGIVFGVKFNKDWMPEFDYAETIEDISAFRGSKYVQAFVGNAYRKAEEFLKQDKKVLFSGTPCQIVGLRKFLRKEYANLLTVDIICHGVPSPKVWDMYLNELCSDTLKTNQSETDASASKKDIIESIDFRYKIPRWNNYSIRITYKGDIPKYCINANKDPYMLAFLMDITLRPSCYSCPAKEGTSHSDIKICDFWGIENIISNYNIEKGICGIIIYTQKGIEAFPQKGATKKEFLLDDITGFNPSYHKSCAMPGCRNSFFSRLDKGDKIIGLINRYTRTSKIGRLKKFVKRCISAIKCRTYKKTM